MTNGEPGGEDTLGPANTPTSTGPEGESVESPEQNLRIEVDQLKGKVNGLETAILNTLIMLEKDPKFKEYAGIIKKDLKEPGEKPEKIK